MRIGKNALMVLMFLVLVANHDNGDAWNEVATHPDTSQAALSDSVLETQNLLASLGFVHGTKEELMGKQIYRWFRQGAEYEDAGSGTTQRCSNHFHDPTKEWTSAGLNDIFNGESSILWAQDGAQQSTYPKSDHSWQAIRNAYYSALTSQSDNQRNKLFADVFTGLGFQMHLVQDSVVPAHVRNDQHALSSILGIPPGPSPRGTLFFGRWAAKQQARVIGLTSQPIYPQLSFQSSHSSLAPIPISDLTDAEVYDGKNPSAALTQGLSEYTNANFFSDSTIFAAELKSEGSKHYFPYPKASSTNILNFDEELPEAIEAPVGGLDYRKIVKKLRDGEADFNLVVSSYLSKDVKDHDSGMTTYYRTFYRDEECHKDYVKHLIPRATGYSAALIDYFFRGRINTRNVRLTRDSGGNIVELHLDMMNASRIGEESQPMQDGSIVLVYKYTPPGMSEPVYGLTPSICTVTGASHPINSDHVSTNNIVLPELIPAGAKDISFFLVFKGRLGIEDDSVATGVIQLTSRIAYAFQPGGSPQPSHIFTSLVDGTDEAMMTNATDGYQWRWAPAWSQDGKLLAFNAVTADNRYRIVVVDLTSDAPYPGNIKSTLDAPGQVYWPSFSPDGTQVLARKGNSEGEDAGLIIFDVATGGWHFINDAEYWRSRPFITDPKWSPKGDRIVFGHYKDGTWYHNIWSISPDGSGLSYLTNEDSDSYHPAWSPDGEEIVFISNRDGGGPGIWIMDKLGGNLRNVFDCPADCEDPSFSPDGEKVVFNYLGDELYSVNLDGTGLTRITTSGATKGNVEWSPDVFPVPVANITATPMNIEAGEVATLTWDSSNAKTATIDPASGTVDVNGSADVAPQQTTTYYISVTGLGGTSTASVTVWVDTDAL